MWTRFLLHGRYRRVEKKRRVKDIEKYTKRLTIKIHGDMWNIVLYPRLVFERIYPDTLGLTTYDHKKGLRDIYLRNPVSCDTIAHELLHVYASYKDFRGKRPSGVEEDICELFGKAHKTIERLIKKINKELNG